MLNRTLVSPGVDCTDFRGSRTLRHAFIPGDHPEVPRRRPASGPRPEPPKRLDFSLRATESGHRSSPTPQGHRSGRAGCAESAHLGGRYPSPTGPLLGCRPSEPVSASLLCLLHFFSRRKGHATS
ncbi:Hypothetical predicted protein [Marmota monax]|uniref:Uncharacterized protein n=1 Tax=Marmota monax TaxID=9995 RepID=A0A5E4BG56_MARMO|nr:Hypothetical predicted protein [Marmota monax]